MVNVESKLKQADAIARKSKFTQQDVLELDTIVKRGLAKRYGL